MSRKIQHSKRLLHKHIKHTTNLEALIILAALHILRLRRLAANLPWPRFTPPTHQRTPVIIAQVLAGMTILLIIVLTNLHANPTILLTIPTYALTITLILIHR